MDELQRHFSFQMYDIMPEGERFVMIDDAHSPPVPTHLVLVQNGLQEAVQRREND